MKQALKRPVNAKPDSVQKKALTIKFLITLIFLTLFIMKKITDFELQSILGGWANPEGCKKVQDEAAELTQNPHTSVEEWEEWCDKFDRECLGI